MYNTMYQPNIDRINAQMNELEKMKQQLQQPAPITQNFQIAPTNHNSMKYANSIEEVEKAFVMGDTPIFSNDMSVLWIKNAKGDIKTYELTEIIPKDAKDIQIELLQAQINELKGMINNDANATNANAEQTTTNTTGNDKPIRETIESKKSTSVSKVSGSKKK